MIHFHRLNKMSKCVWIFDKVKGIIFSATECTSNVWHAVSVLHWTFGVLHLFAMTTRYDSSVAQVLGTTPIQNKMYHFLIVSYLKSEKKSNIRIKITVESRVLGNQLFVKGPQNISIENPLHKQPEKPGCGSKRDVLELATLL